MLQEDNMRVAVIYKPYFFPWMGYFAKLLHAQVFIVQDNVLASNRVWINRSKIIRPDGQPSYITLPIGENGDNPICEIELSSAVRQKSARNISMSIEHAYARSRHFSEWKLIKEHFCKILNIHARLIDIDMALINVLLKTLQLPIPEIRLASELEIQDNSIDNLISNCHETGCDTIILGGGNKDWTKENTGRLRDSFIKPLFQDFFGEHPQYYQTRRERLGFCPGLSILDCILNEGLDATAQLLRCVPLSLQYKDMTYDNNI
jgi:hypothetical protein